LDCASFNLALLQNSFYYSRHEFCW
jgi:hypothetical protein